MRASRYTSIVASPGMAVITGLVLAGGLLLGGCDRAGKDKADAGRLRDLAAGGQVTVEGDDRMADDLTWDPPQAVVAADDLAAAHRRASAALSAGKLYEDANAAIPLYRAILKQEPGDSAARTGLARAQALLLERGNAALDDAADDVDALRKAHAIASVARVIGAADKSVQAYLGRVDQADRVWELNRVAESELREGNLGESGTGGALAHLREVLRLEPGQARARQGLAAVESALLRRAEVSGEGGNFGLAQRWIALAAAVHPNGDRETIPDARARLAAMRTARIALLRDEGVRALQENADERDIAVARNKLAELLRIAEAGDPAAADLRARIDLATHYGLFRPGQAFTDALGYGARGPEMVVVPHGAFLMGAKQDEEGARDSERPQHYVRFDRGFALSRTEVTVAEYGRFIAASGYRTTAARRGYSMVYEQRSGNFVRRNGIDWRHDDQGNVAGSDLPVLHVSARDADAYAAWLAEQSGRNYHLPSEAQFEYALRAGGTGRFPWGDGAPPVGAGNLTGSADRSPGGRQWHNAFPGYDDGYWGVAPVARFAANAYGLHDMAGNVSEWVADCWHDGYRRAPADGDAWLNPGCRERVMRGGAWASAPEQTRSAWRASTRVDTSNARLGFRVAREL